MLSLALLLLTGTSAFVNPTLWPVKSDHPESLPISFVERQSTKLLATVDIPSLGISEEATRRLEVIENAVNLTRGYLTCMEQAEDAVKAYVDQKESGAPASIDTDKSPLVSRLKNKQEAMTYLAEIKSAHASAEKYLKHLERVAATIRQHMSRKTRRQETRAETRTILSDLQETAGAAKAYLHYLTSVANRVQQFLAENKKPFDLVPLNGAAIHPPKDFHSQDAAVMESSPHLVQRTRSSYVHGVSSGTSTDSVTAFPPSVTASAPAVLAMPAGAAALPSEAIAKQAERYLDIAEAERSLREIDDAVSLTRGYLTYMEEVADIVKMYVVQKEPPVVDTNIPTLTKVKNASEAKEYLASIKAACAAAEEYLKYLEGVAAAVRQYVSQTVKVEKEEPGPPAVPAPVSDALPELAEAAALRSHGIAESERRLKEIEVAVNLARRYLTYMEEVRNTAKMYVFQKESGAPPAVVTNRPTLTKVNNISEAKGYFANIKAACAVSEVYLTYLEGVAAGVRQHMSQMNKVAKEEPGPPAVPAPVPAASPEPVEVAALRSEGIAEAERQLKEIGNVVNLTRGYLTYMEEVGNTVKMYVVQNDSGSHPAVDTNRPTLTKVKNTSEAKDYLANIKAACAAAEEYLKYLEGVAAAFRQHISQMNKVEKEQPGPPAVHAPVPAASPEPVEAAALRSQGIAEAERRLKEIENAVNLTHGYLTYMQEVASAVNSYLDNEKSGPRSAVGLNSIPLKVENVSEAKRYLADIKEVYVAAEEYFKYLEGVAATARQHMSKFDKAAKEELSQNAQVAVASLKSSEPARLRSQRIVEAERRLQEIKDAVNLTRGCLSYMQEVADTVKTYVDQEGSGMPLSIDTDEPLLEVEKVSEAKHYLAIIKAAYAAAEEYLKCLEGVAAAVRQHLSRMENITIKEPAPHSVHAQVSAALPEPAEAAALRSQGTLAAELRLKEIEDAVNLTRGYLTYMEGVAGAGKTFVDQKESGALLSDDMDKTLLTKVKDVSVVEDNITNIKEAYAAAKDYLKYLEGVAVTARQHMSQIDKVAKEESEPAPVPAFVSAASSEPKEAAALRSEGIAEAERRLKEIDRSVNLTRGYLAYMQEVADTVKTYVDQEGSGVPSSIDTDRLPLKVDNLSEAKDYLAIIKAACAAAEEYQKYLEGVAAAVRQQVIRTDKITKEEPAPPSVPALSEQAEAAALRSQDIAEGQRRKDEIEGAVNLTRGYLTYMEEVAGAGKTFVDQKESGALLSDDMDKTLLTKVKDVSRGW